MKKRIISVDLGLTGFISIIDIDAESFKVIDSFKIEVEEKDNFVLKKTKSKSKAVIKNQSSFSLNYPMVEKYKIEDKETLGLFEYITSRPMNSQLSMMSLQDSACTFRCLFESLNIPYCIIQPKSWKTGLNIGTEKKYAKELFDKLVSDKEIIIDEKIKSLTKKVKNHNQIESVLIAYYYYKFHAFK